MKTIIYSLIVFLFSISTMKSADDIPDGLKEKLIKKNYSTKAQGYEFYVAIPLNAYIENNDNIWLEMYISSEKPCDVTIEQGQSKIVIAKKRITKPFELIKIGSDVISANIHEVRTFENVEDKVLRISSTEPISVYVLNSKTNSKEGFMAIPSSAWGTQYYHCSYYDNNSDVIKEGTRYFGSGFIVVAKENGTRIGVKLNGKGNAATVSGKKIGDSLNIVLNENQCYVVRGDATTDGSSDLSGTFINSDKPIGLISYHERADLPALINSYPSHICEMMLPISTWGTKYYSVELDRNSKGDLFRVMASEPNTSYKIFWYDKVSKKLISSREGIIKKEGEFIEISEDLSKNISNNAIRGVSVIESDKPIFVMQYSYSQEWDQSTFKPFMFIPTPLEQYSSKAIFQASAHDVLTESKFNFLAIGDSSNADINDSLLKSIKMDDSPLWKKEPSLLTNRIPGTNIYWISTSLPAGVHYINGDTKFSGFVYCSTMDQSYGWIGITNCSDTRIIDTIPPSVTITGNFGEYQIEAKENKNSFTETIPNQRDGGISDKPILLAGSSNFSEPIFEDEFVHWPPNLSLKFGLNVIDKAKEAVAFLQVLDINNNATIKEIKFFPSKLEISPSNLNFNKVRITDNDTLDFELINTGKDEVKVNSIKLRFAKFFKIIANNLPASKIIKANEKIKVSIQYNPKNESKTELNLDIDSLVVDLNPIILKAYISGRGVAPYIQIEDWNADTINVNSKKCNNNGLRISNTGTMKLTVTGIDFMLDKSDFIIENLEPGIPFDVEPKSSIYLKGICFEPKSIGKHDTKIVVHNNGFGPDSIANLSGYAKDFSSISEEIKADLISSITPNPASGSEIAIKFRVIDEQSSTRIMIVNSIGQIVKEINMQQISVGDHQMNISLDGLATGAYNVKILNGQFMQTEKLIIK